MADSTKALQYLLNQDGNKGWVELTQHDDHVTYPTRDGGEDRCPCMWFLNCTRKAVTTVPTGVNLLGDVPACQSCANFANGVR